MTRRLFFRCNGGHYFQGTHCPWDGWTMDGLQEVIVTFQRASSVGSHVEPDLMQRILIIEFGSDDAVFDALNPERYIYNGKEILLRETGPALS